MNIVSYYNGADHLLQMDQETGSAFWAVHGEKMSFTFFEVPPHKEFKKHSHVNEQITHVLEGELYFEADGKIYCLQPGDTIIIPSNIEHRVWTESLPAKAVDSWSPQLKS
jgi:quercetin dioxygenase-like cupin family protein